MTTQTKSSAKPAPKAASAKTAAKPAEKPVEKVAAAPAKPAEKPAETAAAAPAKSANEVKETIVVALEPVAAAEKATEEAVRTAVSTGEQFVASAQEQIEKAGVAFTEGYDEFAVIQKDGLDAWIRAGTILAKGAEDLSKAYFTLAQEAAASSSETARAIFAAKSLQEVVDLQNDFARNAFDKSIAESQKISELSIQIANEAFGPLQAQFNVAVEKALKPLAA